MSSRHLAIAALAALFVLQLLWRLGALGIPASSTAVVVAASLPLFVPLVFALRGHSTALFWSGLLSLFYFSHGSVEAWAGGNARILGLPECLLATLLVSAIAADGLKRRQQSKQAAAERQSLDDSR